MAGLGTPNANLIMSTSRKLQLLLVMASLLLARHGQPTTWTGQDPIAVARSAIKAGRPAVANEALHLTASEAGKICPLCHQYRAEMDTVGDGILRWVQEYARDYPNVPEDRAKRMLQDHISLEQKGIGTGAAFLKKFGKVLSAEKNLWFAQVENRLDLALQLEMAAEVPLLPIEGGLASAESSNTTYTPGIPGGACAKTDEVTAAVGTIDPAHCQFTCVSFDGLKKTVKAGPEVINFDRIRVGDQGKLKVAEELVVRMARPGAQGNDRDTEVAALAPKDARPGDVVAETALVTATGKMIEGGKRTATLRFAGGATRNFRVRGDVDLRQRQVGEQMVFRATEMVAVSVEKPQWLGLTSSV